MSLQLKHFTISLLSIKNQILQSITTKLSIFEKKLDLKIKYKNMAPSSSSKNFGMQFSNVSLIEKWIQMPAFEITMKV